MVVRIHVAGTIDVVRTGPAGTTWSRVSERSLPGHQGRLLLAMLAVEHRRPVSRDELAEELWADESPDAWDVAVRALVSKTRAALMPISPHLIDTAFGAYRWRMPPDGWLDVDAAVASVHRAESALRVSDLATAAGDGLAAAAIARRPFLPGIDSPWVERQRRRLADVRIRALGCTSEVWLRRGDLGESARDSRRILELDPYHEPAIRRLMGCLVEGGQRAEAARTFRDFRARLIEELGVEPSETTQELGRQLLGVADQR